MIVLPYTDDGMSRFNDVQADLEGRVFAGTIGKTKESGGLYRVGRDGNIEKLFAGTGCSNGMGFTPDGQHMFWTCSTTKRIFRFRYHRATGNLTDRELFYQASNDEGTPDGMAVDENGHVWSTRWGGRAVVHHGTDGKVIEKITMPVPTVSSCFFGGPDLSTLFVTTADGKPGSDTADGTLYSIDMPVRGLPEPVSKILI
jgi:D-xylonolactonase